MDELSSAPARPWLQCWPVRKGKQLRKRRDRIVAANERHIERKFEIWLGLVEGDWITTSEVWTKQLRVFGCVSYFVFKNGLDILLMEEIPNSHLGWC